MNDRATSLVRVYRLKVVLVALVSLMVGIAFLVLARFVQWRDEWRWLTFWPISEIGGTLTAAGVFGIAWDFVDGRDKEERENERIRRLLKESAPGFRDAVIAGFAETPENMRAVATTETLDRLAVNALGLRLGDAAFASEIYAGLLAQAIRTPERWYDVDVSIRLAAPGAGSAPAPSHPKPPAAPPSLEVVVTWEYTVTPSHAMQRFACTTDLAEFHDLIEDLPATSTWFMTPRPGVDPTSRAAYELLDFSVDGEPRLVHRQKRRSGQTYWVRVGDDVVAAERPVRIRLTYRTVADPANHRLFLAISQPARNLHVDVDYSAAGVSRLSVSDLVAAAGRPYVSQLPAGSAGRELTIEVSGWVQAGSGLTFVWTLESEETSSPSPRPATRG